MKITILGSGTAIARQGRAGNGVLLETTDTSLLLDCGRQISFQFARTHFDPARLDHICITHPHADHIADLVPLLQSIYVRGLYFPEFKKTSQITLHGYPGFTKDYEKLRSIMFPEREDFLVNVVESGDAHERFGEVTIGSGVVSHGHGTFRATGYHIESEGKSIMYSGDSGYCDALVALAKDTDTAILEAALTPSFFEKEGPRPNHMSPQEAGKVAHEARAKRLVLTHLYPDPDDHKSIEEYRRAAAQYFSGEIVLAEDLIELLV